jgi:D-mannonate dehydratase
MSQDNGNESPNRNGHNLLYVHLSFATIEQSQMQTNPLHFEQDARVDAIYRVIKGNLNWDNLVPTLLEAVQEIKKFPGLKGSEKLDLLQKALKHALKESDKSNEEKEKILYYIDTVVPVAVTAAVAASKIPQVEAVCIGCWTKK